MEDCHFVHALTTARQQWSGRRSRTPEESRSPTPRMDSVNRLPSGPGEHVRGSRPK